MTYILKFLTSLVFYFLNCFVSFCFRCPLKTQNFDYIMYLITVLYHESIVRSTVIYCIYFKIDNFHIINPSKNQIDRLVFNTNFSYIVA